MIGPASNDDAVGESSMSVSDSMRLLDYSKLRVYTEKSLIANLKIIGG